MMNIYYCWHDSNGYGLSAVVSAETYEKALELLDWEFNVDPNMLEVKEIGISNYTDEKVWAEESL
jgi:hypothetical protein